MRSARLHAGGLRRAARPWRPRRPDLRRSVRAGLFEPTTGRGVLSKIDAAPAAEAALVSFAASGFEQRWTASDGALLDFAEAHGLSPDYGCRNGVCGTCAVKLLQGAVSYVTAPAAEIAQGEALICCARPAEGSDTIELDL